LSIIEIRFPDPVPTPTELVMQAQGFDSKASDTLRYWRRGRETNLFSSS